MITEAEIQSIDFNSNSCVVRIPFFETLNTAQDVILTAKFAVLPGIHSGYKIKDIVWVAFEDGQAKNPIIIGKVFKNNIDESNNGGAISCSNLTVTKAALLPTDTSLDTTDTDFDSIDKIIKGIKNLQSIKGIDGLLGGSLSSPLIIKGGDSNKASKIVLSNEDAGQITNNSTATIFGFLTKNTDTLTVGSNTYKTNIRGSQTHPTYNGKNIVLMPDLSYSSTADSIIGTWLDGKAIYRQAFTYTGTLNWSDEIQIGNINAAIDNVLDIRQIATYAPTGETNQFAYNMNYVNPTNTNSKGPIIVCRVDLATGKVYAKSTYANLVDTKIIVIVEYTKL